MSNEFTARLRDYYQVGPSSVQQEELSKLSIRQKVHLIDSMLQKGDVQKGLRVTAQFSSTGRRINHRIYTPSGHRQGVDTWTQPFAKPVLKNHDSKADPLGRVSNVNWVSRENEARAYLKDSKRLSDLMTAFNSEDPIRVYDTMHRMNLLLDNVWPGVGALEGSFVITDEDAVEKFVDGRFLTLSSGQRTNHFYCGFCGSDWVKGDLCDHRPGTIEDNKVAVFVTGKLVAEEISVVNEPADSYSQVQSIEILDNMGATVDRISTALEDHVRIGKSIPLTDYRFAPGEKMAKSILDPAVRKLDPRDIARGMFDSEIGFIDLAGDTQLEISWLIRIHDSLHDSYDYALRYKVEDEEIKIPADVFKLHGAIHELSKQKDFRGSMINGTLDHFSATGEPSDEYVLKIADSEAKEKEEVQKEDLGVLAGRLTDLEMKLEQVLVSLLVKPAIEKPEEAPVEAPVVKDVPITDNLKIEEEVVNKTESDSEAKDVAIESTVNCKCSELQDYKKDYESTLALLQNSNVKIENLEEALASVSDSYASIRGEKLPDSLEDRLEWAKHLKSVPVQAQKEPLENPSLAGGPGPKKLSGYEQTIVTRYNQIKTKDGVEQADAFLKAKKHAKLLPTNFKVPVTEE